MELVFFTRGGGRGGGDLGRELDVAAMPVAVLFGRAAPGGDLIEPNVCTCVFLVGERID